jgi:ABC-type antimicrobial peptide transport system permease subunit
MSAEHVFLRYAALVLVYMLAYFFVLRRFASFVQPYRLRMAQLGEEILAGRVTAARAEQISFFLDNAFSGWVMAGAILVFPFAVFWGTAKYAFGGFSLTAQFDKDDQKMVVLFALSAFAANPLCGTIFAVEAAIFVFIVVMLAGQSALMAAIGEFIRLETLLLGPAKKVSPGAAWP